MNFTEPVRIDAEALDITHLDAMRARDEVRRHALQIRTTIQHWQPRPCPTRKEYP